MASLQGYARLLRLPLFVTAVADVIAGYAVAMCVSGRLSEFDWRLAAYLAGTSTGLYLFGMVENDWVDRRRDQLMGIPRPLVTGEVGLPAAMILLALTALLAGVCAVHLTGPAMRLAIGTLVAINLYNLGAKRGPAYIAMAVMGLCRLLNYGVGVAAAIGIPSNGVSWNLVISFQCPLWVYHGMALFFATVMSTGYSIAARRQITVSSRPWQVAVFVTLALGLTMWFGVKVSGNGLIPPVARVFASLALIGLWPGGLWSGTGPRRTPQAYAPFIGRTLYWLILMDAAFVFDALLASARPSA